MSEKSFSLPDFPWHLVFVGDLNPGNPSLGLHTIDKNSFKGLMEELAPAISISVTNTLSFKPKHLNLDLVFKSIKDFHPDNVVARIPALSSLLEVKRVLAEYHSGGIDKSAIVPFLTDPRVPESLKSVLKIVTGKKDTENHLGSDQVPKKNQKKGNKPNDKANSLDFILSMVDATDENQEVSKATGQNPSIDGLLHSVTADIGTDLSVKDYNSLVATIDKLLADQVEIIIHNPDFIALEKVWRELKFLVDHTNFRQGVKMYVVACSPDDCTDTLQRLVFQPAWNNTTIAPDLIIIGYALARSARDFTFAEYLAKLGQSTQTPIITWAGPQFFDIDHYSDLVKEVPSITNTLRGTGYEKWRGLREKSESEWLVLTTNGFCLRGTYGKSGIRVKSFHYEENRNIHNLPCGAGSVALGALLSETCAGLGSEEILAQRDKPTLESFDLFPLAKDTNSPLSVCCIPLTNDQTWELTDAGLTPLNSQQDESALYLTSSYMYNHNEISIPSMLLAGHITRVLIALAHNNQDMSVSEMEKLGSAILNKIILNKISGISSQEYLELDITENNDKTRNFALQISLPYMIFGHEITVQASFSL